MKLFQITGVTTVARRVDPSLQVIRALQPHLAVSNSRNNHLLLPPLKMLSFSIQQKRLSILLSSTPKIDQTTALCINFDIPNRIVQLTVDLSARPQHKVQRVYKRESMSLDDESAAMKTVAAGDCSSNTQLSDPKGNTTAKVDEEPRAYETSVADAINTRTGSEPELSVLYSDEDIVVLDKPSGLRTVPGKATEGAEMQSRAQVRAL